MEFEEVFIEAESVEACDRVAAEAEHTHVLRPRNIHVQVDNVSFRGDMECVVDHISNCLCSRALTPCGTSVTNGGYLPQKHCGFIDCDWVWKGKTI